jgi:hypothetical protein
MLGLSLTKMFFEISALSGINSKIIRGGDLRRLWGAQIKGDLRAAGW